MKAFSDWPTVRLKEVSDKITVGFVGSMSNYFVDSGVPLLRGQNVREGYLSLDNLKFIPSEIHKKWSKSALRAGDVVIVRVGYPGTAAVVPEGAGQLNAASLVIVRPTVDRLDSKFLMYLLNSPWGKSMVQGRLVGVAQQVFNTNTAADLEIALPPLPIQRRISSILSAYDDLIENNTRRIEILEEMARRLYEEWFVQFRFPGHEGVEFKESELGLAPKGWSPATVKSLVVRLKGGKAYKSEELQGDGSIIVVDQSRAEYLGFHDNEPSYLASPKTPAIIFGDHTCKMQVMVTPFSVGPNTVVFAGQKGHSPYYIYSLVRGLVSTAEYKRHWSDLTGKIVLEAPATLSTSYGEMVSPMFGEIELLRRKNRNLRAQRDLLLPKLISGEIDVSDIPMPT